MGHSSKVLYTLFVLGVYFINTASVILAKDTPEFTESKLINSHHFFGEKVVFDTPQSNFVRNITLNISLPPLHKSLPESSSKVLIFNTTGKLIAKFPLEDVKQTIKVNRKFKFDKILITVQLNYCKDDQTPMCLFKNIVFEVPLSKSKKSEDLELSYTVQEN
jgi:hypothetical protein